MSKTMTEKKPTKEKGFNYKAFGCESTVRKALENLGYSVIDKHNINTVTNEISDAMSAIDSHLPTKELKQVIEKNSTVGASGIAYAVSKACGNYP